ncbi:MAG TPA: hypothetical protein VIL84_01215 [Devosiaceae bacterium]
MTSENVSLFGTPQPPATARSLSCGPLSFSLEDGALRTIRWHGIELVRAINYPARDPDWGTMTYVTTEETVDAGPERIVYLRRFETTDGIIAGQFRASADASGKILVELSLAPERDITANRIGFTILHPIAGLAGHPLSIAHKDGSIEHTTFPERISPAQPATGISGLAYSIEECSVEIAMSGEVFEMEDQRNWSDASFKTYCRPLSLPFPFPVAAGERIEQRIELSFAGRPVSAKNGSASWGKIDWSDLDEPFPDFALAVETGWTLPDGASGLPDLESARRLVRVDLRSAKAGQVLNRCLEGAKAPVDLELVISDDIDAMARQLTSLAKELGELGIHPEHVMALPAAYLSSYQPDGAWPTGATPGGAARAARAAFPGARIGGGMLTNFTEFNRLPPDPVIVDFITHGTTAIVHAADDLSVIETLEALPHIFHSAQALAPGKPYRLGLVSIGARTNPYGSSVASNPGQVRKPLAMSDPRHKALFGAAFMVGAVEATQGCGVAAMALGAPSGPFGIIEPDPSSANRARLLPAFHVMRALHEMKGGQRLKSSSADSGLRVVAAHVPDATLFLIANTTNENREFVLPAPASMRWLDAQCIGDAAADPRWLLHAGGTRKAGGHLPPYALVFGRIEAEEI